MKKTCEYSFTKKSPGPNPKKKKNNSRVNLIKDACYMGGHVLRMKLPSICRGEKMVPNPSPLQKSNGAPLSFRW